MKAIVAGITGQAGSYLAELLLDKGYEVVGMVRRVAPDNLHNIEHIRKDITLRYGDLTDYPSLIELVSEVKPHELYNMAAQSDVGVSFHVPESTGNITGLGVLRLLEAVRKYSPMTRMYQASTSELFGNSPPPQNEDTPLAPNSPYSIAKLYGYWMSCCYRSGYGLHVSNGLLFNMESPRRGENFVTRKISLGVARIKAGLQDKIVLGNPIAKRDWGYCPEYMDAVWRMLQQDKPDDYVVATGEVHTVKEFVEEAFQCAGIYDWRSHVEFGPNDCRPNEVHVLQGDASKAKKVLGWKCKTKFAEIVRIMVDADMEKVGGG